MDWANVTVDEFCSLITDGTHYTPPSVPEGIPFLTVKDMNGRGLDFDGCAKISGEEFQRADQGNSAPKRGDVLFSKDGTVGKVHVVSGDEPFVVLSSIAILRPDSRRLFSQYLGHILKAPQTIHQASNRKTGSALRRIILADLKHVKFPLPYPNDPKRSLAEQKRIAAILDKADAIRHRRHDALTAYDSLLQSTFMDVVGTGAEDYAKWKMHSIESLAAQERGAMRTGPFGSTLRHSEFVDDGIAVLGIDNAVQNRFAWDERRFITPEKYEELQRYTVRPNDVIITIMGTIGRSAVVPEDIPTAITTKHLATITLDRDVAEPEFVSNAIHRHPEIQRQLGATQRGAIMSGLNLGIIKALKVPLPPIAVQRAFAAIVRGIRDRENAATELCDEADDLFNSLVQRAFRGEL